MTSILKGLVVLLLTIIIVLSLSNKKKYESFVQTYKKEIGLPLLAPFALTLIDKFSLIKHFYRNIATIQQKMISLYGTKEALNYTRAFVAQLIMAISSGLVLTLIFAIIKADDMGSVMVIGLVSILLPIVLVQSLGKKEMLRRQAIIFELPEFLNKVILLVNAGETAQEAFTRCSLDKVDQIEKNPLYLELNEAVRKMENNMPFPEALNQLSKKCALQEMSIFTTTLLLNYRKGGEELVRSLKALSVTLWEKRKAQTQIKGEEASSKMIFPLVLVFVIVMIIVGYPALAIM